MGQICGFWRDSWVWGALPPALRGPVCRALGGSHDHSTESHRRGIKLGFSCEKAAEMDSVSSLIWLLKYFSFSSSFLQIIALDIRGHPGAWAPEGQTFPGPVEGKEGTEGWAGPAGCSLGFCPLGERGGWLVSCERRGPGGQPAELSPSRIWGWTQPPGERELGSV